MNRLILLLLILVGVSAGANAQTYGIQWITEANVSDAGGGALSKTVAAGWGNAGAISSNLLQVNTDGWIEFTVASGNTYVLGWATNIWSYSLGSLTYAFYVNANGTLSYYENNAGPSLGSWANGDVLRISKQGSVINYYKNGVVIRTTAANTAYEYRAKVILYSGASPAVTSSLDAKVYQSGVVQNISTVGAANGGVTVTASGGTAPYTYSWSSGETTNVISNKGTGTYTLTIQDAAGRTQASTYHVGYVPDWLGVIGATNSNGQLIKTAAANQLNAGAFTSNLIAANTDGWVEFVATDGNYYNIGFAANLPGFNANDFVNVLSVSSSYVLTSYETSTSTLLGSWQSGDVFRISREGSTVKYYRNGIVIRSVAVNAAQDLRIKTSIYSGIGPVTTSSVDANLLVQPTIQDVSGPSTTDGGISVTVQGGASPYTYSWSSGETTSSISGKARGSYTVTVTDAAGRTGSHAYTIGFNTYWTNLTGVSQSGYQLTKTAATALWDAGGLSSNTLAPNTDGWIEFQPTSGNVTMIGLTFNYTSYDYGTYSNALQVNATGVLAAYEGTAYYILGDWQPGDMLRISRTGTTVSYLKNGVVLRTQTVTTTVPLKIKASISNSGGSISTVASSFDGSIQLQTTIQNLSHAGASDGSISLTATGGVAPYTYVWSSGETTNVISNKGFGTYTVAVTDAVGHTLSQPYSIGYAPDWLNLTGVTNSGGQLTKTSTPNAYDAGAFSSNFIAANTDGWVEFVTTSGNTYDIGFATNLSGFLPTDFANNLRIDAAFTLRSYETSALTNLGIWQAGDIFRISREGSTVNYYRNGVIIRSVPVNAALDLRIKTGVFLGAGPVTTTSVDAGLFVQPAVQNVSGPTATDGGISLTVQGGTLPYTYSWSSGETTNSISGKARGSYTVTITDAAGRTGSHSYSIGFNPDWTNLTGVSLSGNVLTKTATTNAWDAGAMSTNTLPASTDGWLEFEPVSGNTIVAGFSINSTSYDVGTYANAFYLNATGFLYYYEGSVSAMISDWLPGDVLRIVRTGSTITYTKNGVVLRTVTINPALGLKIKGTINNTGGVIPSIASSFDATLQVQPVVQNVSGAGLTDGAISITVSGGTAPYTYSWSSGETTNAVSNKGLGSYTVTITDAKGRSISQSYSVGYNTEWPNLAGVSLSGNQLIKTTSSTLWDAGGVSSNTLASGADGWVEFEPVAGNNYIAGFSTYSSGYAINNFNYGIYVLSTGVINYYEGSGSAVIGNWQPGDVLRIARTGSNLNYLKNGAVLRTVTINLLSELRIKAAIAAPGNSVPAISSSFAGRMFLKATVHGVNKSTGTTGSVSLKVSGGKAPYTYLWSTGEATNSISNKGMGSYTVTVTDALGRTQAGTYALGYEAYWINETGVTESNRQLSKINNNSVWGDAGAITSNLLPANTDGWMEFVIGDSSVFLAGLAVNNSGLALSSFNNGILNNGGNISSYEASGSILLNGAQPGDVIRISREGSLVKYYRNGLVVRTASSSAAYELKVKASIYTGIFPLITTSFDARPVFSALVTGTDGTVASGGISETITGGDAPYGYSWSSGETASSISNKSNGAYVLTVTDASGRVAAKSYGIGNRAVWSNETGVTDTNGILTKTAAVGWGNAGGIDPNVLTSGTDGWLEFVVDNSNSEYQIGFSTVADVAYASADFINSVHIGGSSNNVFINASTSPLSYRQTGDVFRVSHEGTSWKVYRNGAVIYTATITPVQDVKAKISIYSGSVPAVVTSFGSFLSIQGSILPSQGSISLTVSGGTAPYTYSWSSGEQTATISNKPNGNYTVTVTDAAGRTQSKTFTMGYSADWINLQNVTNSSGVLTKTTAAGWGNEGAVSSNLLPPNTDGWMEFVVPASSYFLLGWSGSYDGYNYTDLSNGFLCEQDLKLFAYEGGTATDAGTWQAGDVLRVSREGAFVKYYRNGTVIRSIACDPSYRLRMKAVINAGSTPAVATSIDAGLQIQPTIHSAQHAGDTSGSISLAIAGGQSPYTYTWSSGEHTASITNKGVGTYTVLVTDAAGRSKSIAYSIGYKTNWAIEQSVSESNEALTSTTNSNQWDTGASSSNTLPVHTDGWLEFTAASGNNAYFIGWSTLSGQYNFGAFENAFYIRANYGGYSALYTYEKGISTALGNWQPGDVFRISKEGGQIKYYQNGTVIRTMATDTTLRLRVATSISYGSIPVIESSIDAQILLQPTLHSVAHTGDTSGSISVTAIGGTAPYSYVWSSGEHTAAISNKGVGNYSVTVTDAGGRTQSKTYSLGYTTDWINPTGVSLNNETVTSTLNSNQWNESGAVSSNMLAAHTDGWFEFTVRDSSTYSIGWAIVPDRYGYGDVNNGFYMNYGGSGTSSAYSVENGALTSLGNWIPGDLFRLSREGSQIKYYRNGSVIRTIPCDTTLELRIKTSIPYGKLPVITSSVDARLYVEANVQSASQATSNSGSISLNVNGGKAPYSYVWSSGEHTSSIHNKNNGPYQVTVTDALGRTQSKIYNIAYETTWVDQLGVSESNGILTSTVNSNDWGASGATSSNTLAPNTDGWLEFAIRDSSFYMIGWTAKANSYGVEYFNNAYYISSGVNQTVSLFASEPGAMPSLGNWQPGDIFRIGREGGKMKYYRNGNLIRAIATDSTAELRIKTTIANGKAPVVESSVGARIYLEASVTGVGTPKDTTGSILLSASGGKSPYHYVWSSGEHTSSITHKKFGTYQVTVTDTTGLSQSYTYAIGYKVAWTNETGVSENNGILTCTAPSGQWGGSGAESLNKLPANTDGWLEFVMNKSATFLVGWSATEGYNYYDFTNSFYTSDGQGVIRLSAYEGTNGAAVGTWEPGDVLRIAREGTLMKYYRNGVVLRSVSCDPSLELKIKATFQAGSSPYITTSVNSSVLNLQATIQPVSPTNNLSGGASVVVSGGTTPYTYLWSSGETTAVIANKSAGNYTLTVTDSTGQVLTHTYYIGYLTQWTGLNGVTDNNEVLTKTLADSWYNAEAYSKNVLPASTDGWVTWTMSDNTDMHYMVGFGTAGGTTVNPSDVLYGLQPNSDGFLYTNEGTAPFVKLTARHPGDLLRVERSGGSMNYYQNEIMIHTTLLSTAEDLVVTTLIYHGSTPLVYSSFLDLDAAIAQVIANDPLKKQKLPEGVKLTRGGMLPSSAILPSLLLSSVSQGTTKQVFQAPPCLEGSYYVGFQLVYDLGDKQTTQEWLSQLTISLMDGIDTLWTQPLQVNTKDQTFIATAFYNTPISCNQEYTYVIKTKSTIGSVPEGNIYLNELLYRSDPPVFDPSIGLTLNCPYSAAPGEVNIAWNYTGSSAAEYDIEWAYIQKDEGFTENGDVTAPFRFKEPVRVTVQGIQYHHLVFYDSGKIWYRVRAVGYNPANPDHRIQGLWSYSGCNAITVLNPQPDKNWQQQTVFAEEGKYKKVLHYYDGSMRERQALTNLSTEEITLVGESLYDFEGRKAVDILPVPAADNTLTYKANFNQFAASADPNISANTSGSRHKFNYDNRRLENSVLSNTTGTGQYYSSANTSSSIHKDYIPDAQGYAYSQTEYTNDGTGRVSRQSGVGQVFRADGDHTTRTFYGGAAPAELIRLFGNNVGDASHYKKTMVLDANGQVSVTYHDQEGRTVATALAGDNPQNVDALDSYKHLSPTPITVDITNKNQQDDGGWVINHTILNAVPNTPYSFRYNLSAFASQVDTLGCKACVFDLTITLTDPDGIAVSMDSIPGNQSGDTLRYVRSGITAASCTNATNVNDVQFTRLLTSVGDYTLTKTLTPHELTYDEMLAIVKADATVQQEIQQIASSYTSDASDCAICQQTTDAAITQVMQEVADKDCENIYQQIVADLQTAHTADSAYYEPPIADIKAHPLYCQYALCKQNEASDVYDMQMARYDLYDDNRADSMLLKDPFFVVDSLSGHGATSIANTSALQDMQNKLNDVSVATIGYDSNNDGVQDGTTTYQGPIGQVTDPANTAYYVSSTGVPDPNGVHILYADLMSRKSQLADTTYQKELSEQHWTLYRNFYVDAKRKTKLDIPAYQTCAAAKAELTAQDSLPTTPQDGVTWAGEPNQTDSVSTAELVSTMYTLHNACHSKFTAADSTNMSNHLKNYFNSHPSNLFRVILKGDLPSGTSTPDTDLVAIQGILSHYSCTLDSVAMDDPITCTQSIQITLPPATGDDGGFTTDVWKHKQVDMLYASEKEKPAFIELDKSARTMASIQQDAYFAFIEQSKASGGPSWDGDVISINEISKNDPLAKDYTNGRSEIERLRKKIPVPARKIASMPPAYKANEISTDAPFSILIPQNEYNALVTFYNSTNGAQWTNNTGWSTGVLNGTPDVSGWYGVSVGIQSDGLYHVTGLYLNSNNLSGVLPSEIGVLTYLGYLDIYSQSKMTGNISVLSTLTKIVYLNFGGSGAGLTGNVSSLSGLTALTHLEINSTNLTGDISAFSGMTSLTNLTLYSPGHSLGGNISSLSTLTNLVDIYFFSFTLSGDLIVFNQMSKLNTIILTLVNGQLTGDISSLTSSKNITDLRIENAGPVGGNLSSLGVLHNLNTLILTYNDDNTQGITGDLTSLSTLINISNLQILNAPLVTGGLSSLSTLSQLSTLVLSFYLNSDNKNMNVTGDLSSLAGFTNLQELELYGCPVTGTLSSLSGLQSLSFLDLNNINVSCDIGQLETLSSNLSNIYLNNVDFTGSIPSLTHFPYLEKITLISDGLSGHITTQLPTGISQFIVSGNKFTFSDLLDVNGGYFSYSPQNTIDVKKTINASAGSSLTLSTTIDTNTTPASVYQWFKKQGTTVTPLCSPSSSNYSITINTIQDTDDGAQIYYTITNSALPQLTLTSNIQTLQVSSPTQYTICQAYDPNNPVLQGFTYTVDWNAQIQQCMAREAKTDSLLTVYATNKLMDVEVSKYYNQYSTQCLQNTKENLAYTYIDKEYHYTLYYYDQGANLVQTVPPQGVRPFSITKTDSVMRGLSHANPVHKLKTRYQYNSLNQLIDQTTPDAGESKFWYNDKGQLRVSQNAQQLIDSKYSYTKYDEQGRIVEVGEVQGSTFNIQNATVWNDSIDSQNFPAANVYAVSDVTKTHYDDADAKAPATFVQNNLRSRVAWVEVIDKNATDTTKTHYSYDIHGNVESLLQNLPGLKPKRTDYLYDLVSGKVNYVLYQFGENDQFVHRYKYDADNRITDVLTSSDRFIWNEEANYSYYLHGPLARTELGHYRVQGLDYTYTLQGWIKSVNTPYAGDPGADGIGTSMVGKDVFAYSLGYYQNDYTPINASVVNSDTRDQLWNRALENIQHTGLYNGNISWMVTDLSKIGAINHDATKSMQGMLYRYDQLHRITKSRSLTSYTAAGGFAVRPTTNAYDEDYSYDANGNILTLKRNDDAAVLKDDFAYSYYANTNKLLQHKANGGTYTYDAIGNLTVNNNEGVSLSWTPYGKVRSVTKGDTVTTYRYDASGNRIEKTTTITVASGPPGDPNGGNTPGTPGTPSPNTTSTTVTTYYLRDATGNVMSIYKDTVAIEVPIYGSARVGQYKGGVVEGYRTLGLRNFELSNHLGNVLAVITDNAGMKADSIWASVVSTSDYYPFGLEMKARSWSDTVYRYGFNGKEKDNSTGFSNYDYGDRIYDPVCGCFHTIDPNSGKYPWQSPYAYAANNPIKFIDFNGDGPGDGITGKEIVKTFSDGKKAIKYQLTLYVNQPGSGHDRDTYEPKNPTALFNRDAGHTFIGLKKFNDDGSVTEKIFGWYPGTPNNGQVNIRTGDAEDRNGNKTGSFRDDNGDDFEVSKTFEISKEGFQRVLVDILRMDDKTFNLNTNNCTNAGIQIVKASGNDIKSTEGTWEFAGYSVGKGYNPGDLGEDLRKDPKTNQKPGVAKTADYKGSNSKKKFSY